MDQLKEKLLTAAKAVGRVIATRRFAAAVMCSLTVAMAVTVSVNSHAVTVNDGDETHVLLTMHDDPYKVLDTAGVVLEQHDAIDIDRDTESIDVYRAMAVEVQADGLSTLLHLTEGTVSDALRRADITVGKQDKMNVSADTLLEDGMCITVDRIAYQEYTETKKISFKTTKKYTPVIAPGVTRVLQYGQNGTKTITYRKTIENGKVVATEKVGEKTTKKAVNQVLLVGSAYGTPLSKAPFNIKLDSKNQPVNYKKVYKSKSCTAYSIGSIGASGMRLGVGTCAVNPKVIPYGTKLWITSADGKFVYGYAVAADTGAFAQGNRTFIDLYYGSYSEACYFGRRNLNVYVIG